MTNHQEKTFIACFWRDSKSGAANGVVLGLYPQDREKLWASEGPWPNRRKRSVIGEFPSRDQAERFLIRRFKRFSIGRKAWISARQQTV